MMNLGIQMGSFYRCLRVLSLIPPEEVRCMHVLGVDPLVIAVREALPLDEVLQLSFPPGYPVIQDPFDFLLFLAIDNVGWWSGEVGAMLRCLLIGGKQ
jgi:hypothetical protein